MSVEEPAEAVVWMVRGAWRTMCLRAGCRLGIFDRLDTPRTAPELAAACGADLHALQRLLRALVDMEVLERREGETVANTALGDTLRAEHPSGVRNLALMHTWAAHIDSWIHLDDAVRSGSGVFETVNGQSMWAALSAEPEVERQFNGAMARRAAGQLEAVLGAIDLSGASTVVDVGGGRGALLAGLLQALPTSTGLVADRPDVAAEATAALAAAGLGDRGRGVPADFFDSVPAGGDVYVLSNVLHDWDDDDAVSILRTVHAAMAPGSRLLVVEHVLDVAGRSVDAERDLHLVDLHMLVVFGARERTFGEYGSLLNGAGFPPSRLAAAGASWDVIEATRA